MTKSRCFGIDHVIACVHCDECWPYGSCCLCGAGTLRVFGAKARRAWFRIAKRFAAKAKS